MGLDVSFCFSEESTTIEALADLVFHHIGYSGQEAYVVIGSCLSLMPFFSLYADQDLALGALCRYLSRSGKTICNLWRSDHGGCCGYAVFSDGALTGEHASDQYDLTVLREGYSVAFQQPLTISDDDLPFFPEGFLDAEEGDADWRVYRLDVAARSVQEMEPAILSQLLQNDLPVEPVFRFVH